MTNNADTYDLNVKTLKKEQILESKPNLPFFTFTN